jgi:hypothetical protein
VAFLQIFGGQPVSLHPASEIERLASLLDSLSAKLAEAATAAEP